MDHVAFLPNFNLALNQRNKRNNGIADCSVLFGEVMESGWEVREENWEV